MADAKHCAETAETADAKHCAETADAKHCAETAAGEVGDDDVWPAIHAFFRAHGLLRPQLESFDQFLVKAVPEILEKNSPLAIKDRYVVEFANPVVHAPRTYTGAPVYPMQCAEQNRTYRSDLSLDVTVSDLREDLTTTYPGVLLCRVPVMVRSSFCNLTLQRCAARREYELRECPKDGGGYFVVKGTAKVLVFQDRPMSIHNRVYVFANRKKPRFSFFAEARSVSERSGRMTTTVVGVKAASKRPEVAASGLTNRALLTVLIPYLSDRAPIPLGVLFRALGARSDAAIFEYVYPRGPSRAELAFLTYTLECARAEFGEPDAAADQEAALAYIGKRGTQQGRSGAPAAAAAPAAGGADDDEKGAAAQARTLLAEQLFPHIEEDPSFVKKRYFLGYMVNRLVAAALADRAGAPNSHLDDKDHYANKRVTTAGMLLEAQFAREVRRLVADLAKHCELAAAKKSTLDVKGWLAQRATSITQTLNSCVNRGIFSGKQTGASQNYDRFNHVAALANARKIATPINESGKVIVPRQLHGSHWGICCAYSTPEGKKAGLLRGLALTARVTLGSSAAAVKELLRYDPAFTPLGGDGAQGAAALAKVFVNGDWVGGAADGPAFAAAYRARRRAGALNPDTSVSYNRRFDEVRVYCDQGRLCRPLFVVEDGRLRFSRRHLAGLARGRLGWEALVGEGVVEFLDKEEEDEMFVKYWPSEIAALPAAERRRVTHCELHPSMIFGVSASVIPFPSRNQAPRDSYESQMAKQAVGVPGYNFNHRVKGLYNVLHSPQQPIVQTRAAKTVGLWELPAGVNVVLAVGMHRGYNQEDSLVFNKASLERGLFDLSRFVVHYAEAKKDKDERFAVPALLRHGAGGPPPDTAEFWCARLQGAPGKLDPAGGCVRPRSRQRERDPRTGKERARWFQTRVERGDLLIGRVAKAAEGAGAPYKDASVPYAEQVPGRVHRVERGVNAAGYEYARVVVVQTRRPVIGDKFASCHAQKGTIGQIVPPEDLPFSSVQGVAPDVLINPLAFPSRMTVAMLIEMLLGKAVCTQTASLVEGDGTPFRALDLKAIETVLTAHGFSPMGKERMFDGISGQLLPYALFAGPVQYQRLKHMVDDKLHARARGTHAAITRQPKEGRQQGGGFKVGYMERDNLAAQGAAGFLRDRLLINSDDYYAWFCATCGVPAVRDKHRQGWCTLCKSREVRKVRLPYATKLLMQETQGFGVMMRVLTSPFNETS